MGGKANHPLFQKGRGREIYSEFDVMHLFVHHSHPSSAVLQEQPDSFCFSCLTCTHHTRPVKIITEVDITATPQEVLQGPSVALLGTSEECVSVTLWGADRLVIRSFLTLCFSSLCFSSSSIGSSCQKIMGDHVKTKECCIFNIYNYYKYAKIKFIKAEYSYCIEFWRAQYCIDLMCQKSAQPYLVLCFSIVLDLTVLG